MEKEAEEGRKRSEEISSEPERRPPPTGKRPPPRPPVYEVQPMMSGVSGCCDRKLFYVLTIGFDLILETISNKCTN